MSIWWTCLGLVTAVASAAALYAASPHCRWRLPHPRIAGTFGMLLAVTSLGLWIHAFGAAVGVSTMLATWMLAMIALPWLTLFARGKIVGPTRSP